ncbi:hypothetical protein CDV31_013713, partial [Fusarium ambrosium]
MPFWEWTWEEIGSGIGHCVSCAVMYSAMFAVAAVTAPVWLPLAVISQELGNGNLRIGVTTTGNVYMEHDHL